MDLCFLKPNDMTIPENVDLLQNFGQETVWVNGDTEPRATGAVVFVKATPEALIEWLGGKDVWIGNGLTGFKLERIKNEI